MRPEDQKAFNTIFGSSVSMTDARIDSVTASVRAALRLASELDPRECDRLIRELDALATQTAIRMGAL